MSQAPTGPCITYIHGKQVKWPDKEVYYLYEHVVVTQCPFTECDHLTNDHQIATYNPSTKTLYDTGAGQEWAIKMRPAIPNTSLTRNL
jgi:hypothetical protein